MKCTGIPNQADETGEGTWTLDGTKLTVKTTMKNGKPVDGRGREVDGCGIQGRGDLHEAGGAGRAHDRPEAEVTSVPAPVDRQGPRDAGSAADAMSLRTAALRRRRASSSQPR